MKRLGLVLGVMALTAMMACTAHADIETDDGSPPPATSSDKPDAATPAKTPAVPTTSSSTPDAATAPPAPTPKTSAFDTLFAAATGTPDATNIDGIWTTDADGDDVAKAEARLAFRGDTMTIATRCMSAEETVTVGATVKASYADGTLNVLESNESAQPFDVGNGKTATCRAALAMGKATYTIANGKLDVLGLTLSKVAN